MPTQTPGALYDSSMQNTRVEHDALGSIEVSVDRLWGAQTQRSLENFPIGRHRMPLPIVAALTLIKKAAALENAARGALNPHLAEGIQRACDEILDGRHDDEFPLSVWQTGSGTHTNMNVNEVIANRASEILGGQRGHKAPIHPNDHVNLAQSSNDVFSAAIYMAATVQIEARLLPALHALEQAFERHAQAWQGVVKIGRTHGQDATPLTAGQEASGWAAQLGSMREEVARAARLLRRLAIGGTAVGTGQNAPAGWGESMALRLSTFTGLTFTSAPNKFEALSSHDGFVSVSGALSGVAAALTKIGNDLRLLASGPRCGLQELALPANEPGSSIMPGKVNPSQIEALLMVCARVAGNHTTIFIAAASGSLQLNVAKPVLAYALLESCDLLADAATSFRLRCVDGLALQETRIAEHLERSLMLATALSPEIGYDKAAALAQRALAEGITLREAVQRTGALALERFDELVRPSRMI